MSDEGVIKALNIGWHTSSLILCPCLELSTGLIFRSLIILMIRCIAFLRLSVIWFWMGFSVTSLSKVLPLVFCLLRVEDGLPSWPYVCLNLLCLVC